MFGFPFEFDLIAPWCDLIVGFGCVFDCFVACLGALLLGFVWFVVVYFGC